MAKQTSKPLPESYHTLPFQEISISHVPATSPTPTSVVLLTLSRPQRLNAITAQMIEELCSAYECFKMDGRIKAVVVTGAGKGFSVGADLGIGFGKLLQELKENPLKMMDEYRDGYVDLPSVVVLETNTAMSCRGGRVVMAMHNCQKPIIMAINGPAAGLGITMTLPATIRVASADAKISFAFSRRGLVMEACSSYFLPRLVGLSRALHLATTGETYAASDPLLNQLFSEILPSPEKTVERALQIAADIAKHTSTVSTMVMRDMMCRGPSSAEEAHLLDSKIFLGMLMSKDSQEGIESFSQRREPEFKGNMARDAPRGWPWWDATHAEGSKTKL